MASNPIPRRWVVYACVILPIAISTAVTSALFSIADGVLFRPLPFADPDALVAVDYVRRDGALPPLAYERGRMADREALSLRIEHSGLVQAVASASPNTSLGARGRELGFDITDVDSRFFPMLGVPAAYGRLFNPEDELSDPQMAAASGLPTPAIIAHSVWLRVFGGSLNALAVHEFAGRRMRIVGVMPPGFKFPGETNVWTLLRTTRARPPTYVRLSSGARLSQLASIVPELTLTRLDDALRPQRRANLIVLFFAAGGLALVTWVQVAAFVMASTVARVSDIGVRLALGAGRLQLLARFLAENGAMAGAAALLAWQAARPLTTFVVGTLPDDMVRGQYLQPDLRTLVFVTAVSLVGFALLTLFPFAIIRRAAPLQLLHGRVSDVPLSAEKFRQHLLVAQVTVTAALLYLCGLMVHSLARAAEYDYGFDSQRVLVFSPPFPASDQSGSMSDAQFETLSREKSRRKIATLEALQRAPGIVAAAGFWVVPLVEPGHFGGWEELQAIDGRPITPHRILVNAVSPGFIRALGATLIQGSSFDQPDNLGVTGVAIVNETFVREFVPTLGNGDSQVPVSPIGRVFQTELSRGRIIGVMRDLVYSKVTDPQTPQAFFPSYDGGAARYIVIRTSTAGDQNLESLGRTLEPIWGRLATDRFVLLRDVWRAGLRPFVGQAELLTMLAGSSLLVAVIGLAGFLLYSVRLRSRELAIRASLGAAPATLKRAVMTRALNLVALGLLGGAAIGIGTGRLIRAQLFMVEAADPATIIVVAVMLFLVAWVSALSAARAAARTMPAAVLREG